MDKKLISYLNYHLAGSTGAFLLVQEIIDSCQAPGSRRFFLRLKENIASDRSTLEDLLKRIGHDAAAFDELSDSFGTRTGAVKLFWKQIEPGKLDLFEALEILALGIHGRRLLWVALGEVGSWFPEWHGVDFKELEHQAVEQRNDIELWRIEAAIDTLADEERRSGGA